MANLNEIDRPRTDRTAGRPDKPLETLDPRIGETRYAGPYEGHTGAIWVVLGLIVLAVVVIGFALSGNDADEAGDVDIQVIPPAAEDTAPPAAEALPPAEQAPAEQAPAQ